MLKLLLSGLLSAILLNGCSLFNLKEKIIKISSLPIVKNRFALSIAWRSSVGRGIGNFFSNLHPAFADNIIYAADRAGTVRAFNAINGKEIWTISLAKKNICMSSYIPALLSSGITVANDHVYIGSEKAQVYSLNIRDGSIEWISKVVGEVLSSPVVINGIVLIHTSNGLLQALNEANGVLKWTLNLGTPYISLRGESEPAAIFDMIIVGSDHGYINAITTQHGQIIWQQSISRVKKTTENNYLNDVDVTPVIVDSVVYAIAYNGNLVALDLYSGKIIWKRELGSVTNFIINKDRIYLVDQNDCLLALSIKRGTVLWMQNRLSHRLLTPPVLYNNILVVGDREGYIHWIDPKTGGFIARHKVDNSGFLTKIVVANNELIIQARNGILYVIRINK